MKWPSLTRILNLYSYSSVPSAAEEAKKLENEKSKIPNESAELARWIEERQKQLTVLAELFQSFLKTRDASYLQNFTSKEHLETVNLKEKIAGPCALFHAKGKKGVGKVSEEALNQERFNHDRDVKACFPGIESKSVMTPEGIMTLYIGADTRTVMAAIKLLREQKKLTAEVAAAKIKQEEMKPKESVGKPQGDTIAHPLETPKIKPTQHGQERKR